MVKRKKYDLPNQLTFFDLVKRQCAEECVSHYAFMFVMEYPDAIRTERDKIILQINRLQSKKRKHEILLKQLEGK